jgi:hypothetical protein
VWIAGEECFGLGCLLGFRRVTTLSLAQRCPPNHKQHYTIVPWPYYYAIASSTPKAPPVGPQYSHFAALQRHRGSPQAVLGIGGARNEQARERVPSPGLCKRKPPARRPDMCRRYVCEPSVPTLFPSTAICRTSHAPWATLPADMAA